MEKAELIMKKWGNSYAFIVPTRIVDNEKLKLGAPAEISISGKKIMTAGELTELSKKMGWAKKLKGIDTQTALKKMDKELWPENE